MKIEDLKRKKILILGLQREGVDSYKFLRKLFPKKILGIGDRNENVKGRISNVKKTRWHLGKNYLKALQNYDIIIKSPGIPQKEISSFITKEKKLTSQTEIFFENCLGKIIGVTGTKGKSTTATLIYKILKSEGLPVHLIGNIGKPALSYLRRDSKEKIFVYELSSHQLFNLKKSPQVAVFLNIYPEHLDYYQNFRQYFRAKQNIGLYQKEKDYFVFNRDQKELREFAKKIKAQKIPFSLKKLTGFKNRGWIEKGFIKVAFKGKRQGIMKIKEVPLLGEFNLLNILAAVIIGKIFGVSNNSIVKTIRNFKGLAHRLELVGEFEGIRFYNDSLATVPEATIEALEALGDDVQTILLGGYDRGLDFKKLVQRIWRSKIKTIILFPESGERIWQEILFAKKAKDELPKVFLVQSMKDAVKLSFQNTSPGKICLLSPASPSFGLFKDYKERGNLFKRYVRYFKARG